MHWAKVVTYHPDKHHRRSMRLKDYDYTNSGAYFMTLCTHHRECLWGAIDEGEMRLSKLGQVVNACWQRLPLHFPNLTLDAFVIMPNHLHGILVLHDSRRGAALDQNPELVINDSLPNAAPTLDHDVLNPNDPCEPGVALGQELIRDRPGHLPNAAPLRPRLISGSVGSMVLNFKSVTTRTINRIRQTPGSPVWQRNYYEHIIRNDQSWHFICEYIHNNLRSWWEDQLHPDNPSKW